MGFQEGSLSIAEGAAGMSRRSMLRGAVATVATAAIGSPMLAHADAPRSIDASLTAAVGAPSAPIRGVNLGSWLVLEKWIVPSVFEGVRAGDEFGFCQELGPKAARERLQAHRDKFITEADFEFLAASGINAVRLPVGYWVLGGEPPFVDGLETLDKAFLWAKNHNLKVMLDLHGAPGSQNGNDHSGKAGPIEWHTKPENIEHTLKVLDALADRYKDEKALYALELLNEPNWVIPIPTLKAFYQDGYHRLRKYLPKERVAIVFHDGFRSLEWADFMQTPEYENVILDTHQYQCFTDADRKRAAAQQIQLASVGRTDLIGKIQKQLPTCVGEWSLGLPGEVFRDLSPVGKNGLNRAYAGAQLLSYDRADAGWFFWTYKTESAAEWSLRESIKRGWMPGQYS